MEFKFGDVVVNGCASFDNPLRKGIFIQEIQRSTTVYEFTNGKGRFWCTPKDNDKLIKIENVIKDGWEMT